MKFALVVVFGLSLTSLSHGQAVCTDDQFNDFFSMSGVPPSCRVDLSIIRGPNQNLDNELTSACNENCAGRLAAFEYTTCKDTADPIYLYTLCIRAGDPAPNLGSYCRYAMPPQFVVNATLTGIMTACGNVSSCSTTCQAALDQLIADIGCCLESVYKTPRVINALQSIGVLSNELGSLISAAQDIFSKCDLSPQNQCNESFVNPIPFPTTMSTATSASVSTSKAVVLQAKYLVISFIMMVALSFKLLM